MSEHVTINFFQNMFSLDHKMISKQFLITGMIMGVIAMGMSALFYAIVNLESKWYFKHLLVNGQKVVWVQIFIC